MMVERVPVLASLRLRLLVGAALIALVAVFAAILAAFGVAEAARMIERSATAQQRIDLLSGLSARVSDYAVVTVETADPDVPVEARQARLASQSARVREAFAALDKALEHSVAEVEADGEAAQMRRATRSLGLARMRAQFEALERNIDRAVGQQPLRAYLDGFATQFSPLLNEAVSEEQRDRDSARRAVEELRKRMVWQAMAAGIFATVLVALYYILLVRPVMSQLNRVRGAAAGIGAGKFDIQLPVGGKSELSRLMQEVNRTAQRLKERQEAVDQDRAQLGQIIAERTVELEAANEQLSQIDAERRRFFADIGHELRTPLTVILAESELGLSDTLTAKDGAESLSVIHARAKRLNRRIDDLLRVARSETGQIELLTGPFDLSDAAASAVADMEPLALRRGMHLVSSIEPTSAYGDPDWCRQVISGLIENALKKSPKGGVIEVKCAVEGKNAVLFITDEGEGLPDGEAERIFTRFARGSRETAGSGFGVGLALARWVIERQSGTISLKSPAPHAPEGGTTGSRGVQVVITMPISGPVQDETT